MIYTKLTCKALKLAYDAHNGQQDKSGVPYIFHPFHLAEQMEDEVTTCVALLHDVVEDTDVTMEELKELFPKEVTDALELLTHDDDTEYLEYVKKITTNPVAKAVKIADMEHNMDESRLQAGEQIVPEEKINWWREKYSKAYKILKPEE